MRANLPVADTSSPPFAVPERAPISELIDAYQRTGSVWKAGEILGIKGSTVHGRLRKAGIDTSVPPEFTPTQINRIKQYYADTAALDFDLDAIATELGKSRHNICRKARRLGLSNQARPSNGRQIQANKRPKWRDKPHPRGMAGKRHGPEAKDAISKSSKRNWSTWKTFGTGPMTPAASDARAKRMQIIAANRVASTVYTRTKGGHREDLGGVYFRSSWEANYARYLNFLIQLGVVEKWDFEPETFWFEGIRRGAVSYKPDFRIKYKGDDRLEYIEIKGWIVAKDRTKWRRMKKYHPTIKLIVIGAKEYYAIQKKFASAIPHWETQKSTRRVSRETVAA